MSMKHQKKKNKMQQHNMLHQKHSVSENVLHNNKNTITRKKLKSIKFEGNISYEG